MMKKYLIAIVVLAVLAIGFGLYDWGYSNAERDFELKYNQEKTVFLQRLQIQEEKLREKEQQAAESMVSAWAERDRAFDRAHDANAKFERMRHEFDAYRTKMSRANASAGNGETVERGEGIDLLARSTELLGRCEALLRKEVADKDAVVKIYEAARTKE